MNVIHVDGLAIVGCQAVESRRFATEAEAVAWAESVFGPRLTQVSLTTVTAEPNTFAVRHWSHSRATPDSGWRWWRDGVFVGDEVSA